MRPAMRAGLVGNASLLTAAYSKSVGRLRFGARWKHAGRIRRRARWKKQEQYSRAYRYQGEEFETGQFQGWIKGTT